MIRPERINHRFHLRCCFEYANGTVWKSLWNRSDENPGNQAWERNREGLRRAFIEMKNLQTKQLIVAAECSGQDFCNFQWAHVVGFTSSMAGQKLHGQNVGLILRTREHILSVFVDGSHRIDKRTDDDKKIQFATYGR